MELSPLGNMSLSLKSLKKLFITQINKTGGNGVWKLFTPQIKDSIVLKRIPIVYPWMKKTGESASYKLFTSPIKDCTVWKYIQIVYPLN